MCYTLFWNAQNYYKHECESRFKPSVSEINQKMSVLQKHKTTQTSGAWSNYRPLSFSAHQSSDHALQKQTLFLILQEFRESTHITVPHRLNKPLNNSQQTSSFTRCPAEEPNLQTSFTSAFIMTPDQRSVREKHTLATVWEKNFRNNPQENAALWLFIQK